MSLKDVARQTLDIIQRGGYDHKDAGRVEFASEIEAALAGTVLHTPVELSAALAPPSPSTSRAEITVSDERTQEAALRLTADGEPVVLLNFASARNPGGGFEGGAKAQEEDLARCSALVPCLQTQFEYYRVNREQRSMLYTDHIIYSPDVPFFRVRSHSLLPRPFLASVITAPAPNAGQHLRRQPDGADLLHATLVRRAGYVLWVAKHHGHRRLLLGAWGCGVFRNDPVHVARAFRGWLDDAQFADAFDLVHFGVYDPTKQRANFRAFEAEFG